MTVYPQAIDDDRSILRIDDNLSELGTAAINQLRSAVFAIEKELGTTPSGSRSSLDSRISVSLNEDGTLKTEAIIAAGLIALPIVDSYIANNAGIKEFKLDLDVGTLDLQAQIDAIDIVANNTASLAAETNADLLSHIAGAALLADGLTRGRHYDNQIDLSFTLYDYEGSALSAIQVEEALYQINQSLVNHQTSVYNAHPATSITVFAKDWNELPSDAENLQEVLDFIDNQETLSTGIDRATMQSNGIPRNARVQRIDLDGYNYEIVPETKCRAFLAELSQTGPRDSISNGDDVIIFHPEDNSDFSFDAQFTQVQVGDILRINYGNGISGQFRVSSIRLTPGTEWAVRIDGWNLANCDGTTDGYAYARIDRRRHDIYTQGVLAVAAAHADTVPDGSCSTALDGIIIGSPRGASATGIGFDPGALNEKHYKLWLRLYPSGNPDEFNDLYPIDVTGNEGTTPGAYTLDTIVEATNRAFRASGYNYRFIAFQHKGEFGVMLADPWMNAAFTIIAGKTASTIVEEGVYTNNVVGDATDGYDALGFGARKAVVASPVTSGYTDKYEAVNMPTIIHSPTKGRDYLTNGARQDFLRTKTGTQGDGYWNATVISSFNDVPNNTITTTYRINKLLMAEELAPGKTIVVQPVNVAETSIVGYGRFIVGDVLYNELGSYTDVTVINSVHAGGSPMGGVLGDNTTVIIYFTEDSVNFNTHNLVEQGIFHRYHEIFVDQYGKTNAIERARVVKQSADTSKINTDKDNWQIRNVSSKLKGYRLDDNFRNWIRFYIVNYNATTGEYDGYIGSPPDIGAGWETNPGIVRNGPLTRATKNNIVRFYDETYVNFIDIEYRELGIDPGSVIAAPPQYIDIEIFQSMVNDDEVMRIAGVSHNETIVGSITDLREFGTVSEENFTDSAIKFIESGERFLHTNGVIRGFEYTGTGVNEAVLQLSGGLGLINGSFVAISEMDVVIPEMIGSSDTYNVFVCATKNGTLRTIPENTGAQFFQSITGEFVESYTFQEIIDSRKELLLLYVVNVTIYPGTLIEPETGNLTLNSVSDARKYVLNETANITLSISDKPETSSFTTFDQIITWAKETTAETLYIKVRGDVEINSTIDLTSITSKIVFEGDGGVITVNTPTGFLVKSGVQFRNLKIVYNSILTSYDSSNLCHLSSTQSCIRFAAGASNCRIERCDFSQTIGERYPYIALYSSINPGTSGIIENIYIEENVFHDSTSSSYNCAVGFYQSGISGSSHVVTTLRNIKVNKNVIEGYQSILMTCQAQTFKTENVEICGNNGSGYSNSDTRGSRFMIGVSARRTDVSVGGPSTEEYDKSIRICDNNCSAIYPAGANGKYLDTLISSASFMISGNECYSITAYGYSAGGVLYIQDNVVNYPDLITNVLSNVGLDTTTTIQILGSGNFQINRNQVYVASDGIGIKVPAGLGNICNNRLHKAPTAGITAFIDAEGSNIYANIFDNFLNSTSSAPWVGGTTYVLKHSDNCVVDRNINDVITKDIDAVSGKIGACQDPFNSSIFGIAQGDYSNFGLLNIILRYDRVIVNLDSTSSSILIGWKIPLAEIAPYSAKILSLNYTAYWSSSSGTMTNVVTQAWLADGNTSIQTSGAIAMPNEVVQYPVSMNFGSGIQIQDKFLYIRIYPNNGGGSSDSGSLNILNPRITWTY